MSTNASPCDRRHSWSCSWEWWQTPQETQSRSPLTVTDCHTERRDDKGKAGKTLADIPLAVPPLMANCAKWNDLFLFLLPSTKSILSVQGAFPQNDVWLVLSVRQHGNISQFFLMQISSVWGWMGGGMSGWVIISKIFFSFRTAGSNDGAWNTAREGTATRMRGNPRLWAFKNLTESLAGWSSEVEMKLPARHLVFSWADFMSVPVSFAMH